MNETMWDGLVGAGMPLLIAFLNQSRWSKPVRGIVAVLACLLAAAVTVWLRGELDVANWTKTAMVITGVAMVSYHTWWKPSSIGPRVERATSTRV